MYINVHAVTGTLCTLGVYAITKDITISAIVGGLLAFGSHDVMDRLGEFHYPTTKFLLLFEGALFSIFFFLALKSDQTLLYSIGWIGGNLMDIIDKKLGLSLYNLKKYPYGSFFPCHRRNPNINLTLGQTIALGVLATIILALFYLIEKT